MVAAPGSCHSRGMSDAVTTKLLICEDDPRVRQTLSRVAGSQADLEVVAAVDNGEDAIDVATDPGVDVIVLDLHLPTIDGIEVIRLLRERGVSSPVVVLSADDRGAGRLVGFDHVSFLSKGTSGALDVLAAIRGSVAHA
jgi:DNA-binding NarL/FixJ family response regulator